jgi:CheY-like chemotaxis protein
MIDDEERDRYVLRQKLGNLRVSISEATSGAAGIQAARQDRPDLIFLDLTMPDMTGFETLRELSKDPSTANIPVIVVTSRVLTETERAVLMQHAAAILSKASLDRTNIEQLLRDAIRGHSSVFVNDKIGVPK